MAPRSHAPTRLKKKKTVTISEKKYKKVGDEHIQMFYICFKFRDEINYVVLCGKNTN